MTPTLTLLAALLLASHAADAPAKKPSALLIVGDDLNGYIEGRAFKDGKT